MPSQGEARRWSRRRSLPWAYCLHFLDISGLSEGAGSTGLAWVTGRSNPLTLGFMGQAQAGFWLFACIGPCGVECAI
jgi:hypothetical protein